MNGYGTGAPGTTTAANAKLVIATTITEFGGQANYRHWWTPTLRSTLSAGIVHQDIPTSLLGPISSFTVNDNKAVETAHANLIWSPVGFVNTGLEYVYGHRQTIWNTRGDEHVLDLAFQIKF